MSTWMRCNLCGLDESEPNVTSVTVSWNEDGTHEWLCNWHA